MEAVNQSVKKIIVSVEKDPVQVTNCPCNFTVIEAGGWDLGAPIGNGATLEKAMEDFESSWELKYDEQIKAVLP